MVRRVILAFLICSASCQASSMKTAKQEGETFGKQELSQALDSGNILSTQDLLPPDMRKRTFDAEKAKHDMKEQAIKSEVLNFLLSEEVQRNERENKGFDENEFFLNNSDDIAQHAKDHTDHIIENEAIEYSMHTCKQSGDPFIVTLIRELQVNVIEQPEIREKEKICLGHEIKETYFWKEDARKAARKYERELAADPTVKSYDVDYKGSAISDYVLRVTWYHHRNIDSCHHYKMKDKVVQEASSIETGEQWIYDNPALVPLTQTPDCTLIEQACIDSETTKTINNKKVTRKCWKEKLSYFYQFPQVKDCLCLKNQNCEQIEQNCLHPTPFGCALWEKTFKCFSKIIRTRTNLNAEDAYGLDSSDWPSEYEPNHSFAEVATKLSVFEEIKTEFEKSQTFDATRITIFKGQKAQCSKNVAGDLMYDCCFSYKGLAKQVGLTKCNSDELALAEMREKGLCHYVGSYEEKMLDLWKSRDIHVFCCFPTKLSRVVQEEGRKQLQKGWGTPERPNCGGFSFEEISKLNFSEMDLSEIFDQMPNQLPEGFEQKMDAFQNRLKLQVEKEEITLNEKRNILDVRGNHL